MSASTDTMPSEKPSERAVAGASPATDRRPPFLRLHGGPLLLLSMVALTMAWVKVNLYTESLHGWMAVVVALDVAWMLRFGGWRPGIFRALLGLGATALVAIAVQWLTFSSSIGSQLGMSSFEAAVRLGVHHAWTLATLSNGPWDLGCLALATAIALLASR